MGISSMPPSADNIQVQPWLLEPLRLPCITAYTVVCFQRLTRDLNGAPFVIPHVTASDI